MIVVKLTWAEIVLASLTGMMRQIQNMKNGAEQRFGAKDEGSYQRHIIACQAEMALAKHLDRFWSGALGDYSAADVGMLHQVRATDHSEGRLILHPDDKDDAPYVLARVNQCHVTLVGWLYGREGKQKQYWSAPSAHPNRPAFFVPNMALNDMVGLPE